MFLYKRFFVILLYTATHTYLNIAVVAGIHARLVGVVKYLDSTTRRELVLRPESSKHLSTHVDANWAGEPVVARKSGSAILVYYGSPVVSYQSSLQECVTLISTKSVYVAISESAKLVMCLQRILHELGFHQDFTAIMQDSSSAMKWATSHQAED